MTDPITGSYRLTKEQVERLNAMIERLEERGGSVTISDPRVSSFIAWAGIVLGSILVASITWGVSTMQELNVKVGILIAQHEADAKRNDQQDDRIRALEQRK